MQTLERPDAVQAARRAYAAQDYARALANLEEAEREHGPSARISHDIGVVRVQLNDLSGALARFREAAQLTEDPEVLRNIVAILAAGLEGQLPPAPLQDTLQEWSADSLSAVFAEAQGLTDEAWFRVVEASARGERFCGHYLPGFVDPKTQALFVGNSGEASLREATAFLRAVLRYARAADIPLDGSAHLLDFGCGWGRYTRYLLKYTHPDRIVGVDIDSHMVERCRRLFGGANFLTIQPFPPTQFRDGLFDLSLGYSVFSHLSPNCADAWIKEFARIVRPGGLVVMTTQGRWLIELCRRLRGAVGMPLTPHQRSLAAAFVDEAAAYAAYDAGEFLFCSQRGPDAAYGEAIIPRGYIERHWLDDFELVDFVHDRSVLPQAMFVLQRR